MKRILLIFALLLAFALPAWAADGTWTNATEDDKWDTAGNWDGGVPGAPNDEAIFDGSEEGRGLPSVNLPDLNALLIDLIFAADYSTVEAGSLSSTGLLTAEVVARDGNVILDQTALWGQASNGTLTLKAGVEFDNTFTLFAGGIITPAGAGVVIDGGVSTGENGGTLDWGNGNLTVIGYMKANECIITHINTTGAALTCDTADNPNLDLGTTDANSIAITTSAAVTIGNSFACGTFTMGADVVGGSKTITAGAGGFTFTNGTISGTLTVDLSGAAGAFTLTAGTIAPLAVLDVKCGTGGAAYNQSGALVKSGVLYLTMEEDADLVWIDTAFTMPTLITCIDRLTINDGVTVTQTDKVTFNKLIGGATATLTSGGDSTYWRPTADTDDWEFTGTIDGTGNFVIAAGADNVVVTGVVEITGRPVYCWSMSYTVTIGGLVCDGLYVYNGATGTSSLVIDGNSSGTTIELGVAGSAVALGAVEFGVGYKHIWSGTIQRVGTGTANAITFGGRVYLGGTVTLAGIVTDFGSTLITATSNITIDGASAGTVTNTNADLFGNGSGKTLTVTDLNNTSATYIRGWNAEVAASTGNTNVQVLPGAPSGLAAMGMGN